MSHETASDICFPTVRLFPASPDGGYHPDQELYMTPTLTQTQRHAWLVCRGVVVFEKAGVAVRAHVRKFAGAGICTRDYRGGGLAKIFRTAGAP